MTFILKLSMKIFYPISQDSKKIFPRFGTKGVGISWEFMSRNFPGWNSKQYHNALLDLFISSIRHKINLPLYWDVSSSRLCPARHSRLVHRTFPPKQVQKLQSIANLLPWPALYEEKIGTVTNIEHITYIYLLSNRAYFYIGWQLCNLCLH